MTAKRALFLTPTRAPKRRKTSSKKSAPMRIPKALLPETKQFTSSANFTSSTSYAVVSVPNVMSQGDGGNQFVGSKLRVLRIRYIYDFTQITLTDSVRLSVVIPKDPTDTPTLSNNIDPWDTQEVTVLHDSILPDDASTLSGILDIKGPINVEFNTTGTAVVRNNVFIYLHSVSNGSNLASSLNGKFCVWYTDA